MGIGYDSLKGGGNLRNSRIEYSVVEPESETFNDDGTRASYDPGGTTGVFINAEGNVVNTKFGDLTMVLHTLIKNGFRVGIGSDGNFYAGRGYVVINEGGITVNETVILNERGLEIIEGASGVNAVKWVETAGASPLAQIFGDGSGTPNKAGSLVLAAVAVGGASSVNPAVTIAVGDASGLDEVPYTFTYDQLLLSAGANEPPMITFQDRSGHPAAPAAGFTQLYSVSGVIYRQDSGGVPVAL